MLNESLSETRVLNNVTEMFQNKGFAEWQKARTLKMLNIQLSSKALHCHKLQFTCSRVEAVDCCGLRPVRTPSRSWVLPLPERPIVIWAVAVTERLHEWYRQKKTLDSIFVFGHK